MFSTQLAGAPLDAGQAQPHSPVRRQAAPVILDIDRNGLALEADPDRAAPATAVPDHVADGFLEHASQLKVQPRRQHQARGWLVHLPGHFETRAIHVGQEPDPLTGAVVPPIYQTSTYAQEQVGVHKGYEYSRTDNPTRTALHQVMASLEGGAWALAYASGLAATQNLMLYLLRPGDHILLSDDAYGGTYRLAARVVANYGIDFSLADLSDRDALKRAIRPETKTLAIQVYVLNNQPGEEFEARTWRIVGAAVVLAFAALATSEYLERRGRWHAAA